jgi:hypothetical protein
MPPTGDENPTEQIGFRTAEQSTVELVIATPALPQDAESKVAAFPVVMSTSAALTS